MTIQESLDRLVDILSSVDNEDLSEAYPHIAEALEIDTENIDTSDNDAMVESIKNAVSEVESDDVEAVVEEIKNFFDTDELDEGKRGPKKGADYDDEQGEVPGEQDTGPDEYDDDDDDEDEKDEEADYPSKKQKEKMKSNRGKAPSYKKGSTKKESHFVSASDLDVSEDVGAMLNGEELSEEFQEKAKTIFEAAVVNKVNEKVKDIVEEFDDLLEEKTQELEEQYTEKLDEFLNYVVQEWVEENKLAVTSGIRSEMTESFINSLRDVFDEHYIEVPEEKMNVVEDLQAKVEELEKGLNEALDSNAKLNKQLLESKREDAIEETMDGLSDYQKEKLRGLLENVELDADDEDLANFKEKAETIRENYFPQNDGENITEELDDSETEGLDEELNPTVAAYASALSRLRGNR